MDSQEIYKDCHEEDHSGEEKEDAPAEGTKHAQVPAKPFSVNGSNSQCPDIWGNFP